MTTREIEAMVREAIRRLSSGRVIRVYIADVCCSLPDVEIELVHAVLNRLEIAGVITQYGLDHPRERTTRHETYANCLGAGGEARHILYADGI